MSEKLKRCVEECRSPVSEFLNQSMNALKENLYDILLFGSTVRGDFVRGISDMDFIVILKNSRFEDFLELSSIKKSIMEKYDIYVNIQPYLVQELQKMVKDFFFFSLEEREKFFISFLREENEYEKPFGRKEFLRKIREIIWSYRKTLRNLVLRSDDLKGAVLSNYQENNILSTILERSIYYTIISTTFAYYILVEPRVIKYPEAVRWFSRSFPEYKEDVYFAYNCRVNWRTLKRKENLKELANKGMDSFSNLYSFLEDLLDRHGV